MAGGARIVVALLAGILIINILPHSYAEDVEDVESYDLELVISNSSHKEYYQQGDVLRLNVSLQNPGEIATISNNPSCDYFFKVTDYENKIIFTSESRCRDQQQTLQILPNENLQFMNQNWDFTYQNGEPIASGDYKVEILHSRESIDSSFNVVYYANSNIHESLDIRTEFVNIDQNMSLAQIFVINPYDQVISTEGVECAIVLRNQFYDRVFEDCFRGSSKLHPHENVYSANAVIPNTWINGDNSIQAYFMGDTNSSSTPNNNLLEINQNEGPRDVNNTHSLPMTITEDLSNIGISVDLSSVSDLDCIAEIFIISDLGELAKEESVAICGNAVEFENLKSQESTPLFSWDLKATQNCFVGLGKYTIIANIGGNYYTEDYLNLRQNELISCAKDYYNIDYQNYLLNGSIYTKIDISTDSSPIRLYQNCFSIIDYTIISDAEYIIVEELCDYTAGNFITPTGSSYKISKKTQLPATGELIEIAVKYKIYQEFSIYNEETLYLSHGQLTDNLNDDISISGQWRIVQHQEAECWMISSPNMAYMVVDNKASQTWYPKEGWKGQYSATISSQSNDACEIFGLPLVSINSVYEESQIGEQTTISQETFSEEEPISITEIAVVSLTSTSLILGMLVFVSNTESLRIPTTTAGLWLLGLVGKTHETSDGRFQRGRLIGYLTANPGCHFRALMAALSMSNGQITHHLRLLENQELIWRVNDGRFVRYYPLNNSLYPGMNPENLPVPLLSPDPKSLQGKILTLLDDEHQYGDFPTQSELAKKLEKSQQLISHHLRTLQKYGLVEKRKMGIKNRYKLTKEAIFLLETDIQFVKLKE